MGQTVAFFILIFFLSMLFFSTGLLLDYRFQAMEIKESLNLSAKTLAYAVELDPVKLTALADGYNSRHEEVYIRHDLLLQTFHEILAKNYRQPERLAAIRRQILIKVLVYPDRFYFTDPEDRWSEPQFFTYGQDNHLYYLTTGAGAYTYSEAGEKETVSLSQLSLTPAEKEALILDKLSQVLQRETARRNEGVGLQVEIQNAGLDEVAYRLRYGSFNVLEGITFFVVYGEQERADARQAALSFRKYEVTGYTLTSQ